ncbi:MAG TPA: ribosome biogenesis GTP-binding protein YsxC, partial [Leptospiraceae bacterium]|nr:ribosome biogenesis GTP-binding protein YsxC [Leptospiraceae bacterium]
NIFQSVYYRTTYSDPQGLNESPLIAFTGRSNAGKSSLISALCNQKNLARAARTPGKTRNLNIFEGKLQSHPFYFCDLPGFGYANLPRDERERLGKMIESFFLTAPGLTMTLILCDSARWPGEEEAAIEQILLQKGALCQWVFTRWDRLNQKEKSRARKRWKEMGIASQAVAVSSTKGTGLNELRKRIQRNVEAFYGIERPVAPRQAESEN